MTRTSGEVVRSPRQTASGDAGTAHGSVWHQGGSLGRSAPYAASRRSEGGRPARRLLAPARGAEDMSVLREQIIESLAEIDRLCDSRDLGKSLELLDRFRRVVGRDRFLAALALAHHGQKISDRPLAFTRNVW